MTEPECYVAYKDCGCMVAAVVDIPECRKDALEQKVAVEIEGGLWQMGRHNRPRGYQNDLCKYNAAEVMGWHVLRYSPQQVKTWTAAAEIATVVLGKTIVIG